MAVIRHPLSGHKSLEEVSLYRAYADLARQNLKGHNYFEAIVICSIGLDVLINTIPDRLLQFSSSELKPIQKKILNTMRKNTPTAGQAIRQFKLAHVLDKRVLRALHRLNQQRNKVIHPIKAGRLKAGAITPPLVHKDVACRFYRLFCHAVDVAGGQSPCKAEKRLVQYIENRKRHQKKRFGEV